MADAYMHTQDIADKYGIRYQNIMNMIRNRKFAPPPKDRTGRYVWGPKDVERLLAAARCDLRLKINRDKIAMVFHAG